LAAAAARRSAATTPAAACYRGVLARRSLAVGVAAVDASVE